MFRVFFLTAFGICLLALPALAQTPTATPPVDTDEVVKISVDLVQIDAVVVDKNGNQVTDLTAADFELWQDGKSQKISNAAYVATGNQNAAETTANTNKLNDKNQRNIPPVRVRPNEAGRILTFVVDDGNCRASQGGVVAARDALEKFVNRQMLPNDLVAVYQTRNGSSLVRQYTSDKNELLRTIRRIRWYPPLGTCGFRSGGAFESARSDSALIRSDNYTFESEDARRMRENTDAANAVNQVVGSTGVLRYVVRGLDRVAGRKIVFFMSDGISIRDRNGSTTRAYEVMRDIVDAANRASVAFHSIDARGLLDPAAINAEDELSPEIAPPNDEIQRERDRRQGDFLESQNGLEYLAYGTGGRMYRNMNFLDVAVERALNAEKGYYLLAYEPSEETFRGKEFHNILVRVRRPGLSVRARRGFLGVTDAERNASTRRKTGDSELYEAIVAPLPKAGLNLKLSAFFANTVQRDNFIRALVHIDGDNLAFADAAGGNKKAVFDVIAVTLNEKNEAADEFNRTHTIQIPAVAVAAIKQNGLIYQADVPVKKAGTYNFRIALRDTNSKLLGSAGQVVEIPEMRKDRLLLSGLTLGETKDGKPPQLAAAFAENAFAPVVSPTILAVRRFRPGMILAYSYTVYNAAVDKATNQPKLIVQTKLYRDGELIGDGQPQPVQLEPQTDSARLNDYGYLRINPNAKPGDYALQVIVSDATTNKSASQWIDFEVEN